MFSSHFPKLQSVVFAVMFPVACLSFFFVSERVCLMYLTGGQSNFKVVKNSSVLLIFSISCFNS